jgi:uncharacterized repeat protein (TIGR01451 family)
MSSFSSLGSAAQTKWAGLLHLKPDSSRGGSTTVTIDRSSHHPVVVQGKVGDLPDFVLEETAAAMASTGLDGESLLGRAGTSDVLLAFQGDGSRSVSQAFSGLGSSTEESRYLREKLFKNSVWWLLHGNCGLADLSTSITVSSGEVAVGEPFTYNIIVQHSGECAATGVRLVDALPSGVTFVSASTTYGQWRHEDGRVTFDLGYVPSAQRIEMSIVAQAIRTGGFTNSATVMLLGDEVDPFNNTTDPAAIVNVSGGSRVSLQLLSVTLGQPRLQVTAEPGQTYVIERSTDLVTWVRLHSDRIGVNGTFIFDDVLAGGEKYRFYRAKRE